LDKQAKRKLQRTRLIEARKALADREQLEAALQVRVAQWLRQAGVHSVGYYFPIRGEPDLRGVIERWLALDAHHVAALPVVRRDELEFHAWSADAPLLSGSFGIPVPAHGRVVQPECLLVPCVAFDRQRFRLGYGGGYYDRTLANLAPWPMVVGIAFDISKVDSIDAEPHDVSMDVVLTDAAQY